MKSFKFLFCILVFSSLISGVSGNFVFANETKTLTYPPGLMKELKARLGVKGQVEDPGTLALATLNMDPQEHAELLVLEEQFLEPMLKELKLGSIAEVTDEVAAQYESKFQQFLKGLRVTVAPHAGIIIVNSSIALGGEAGVRISQFLLAGLINQEGTAWERVRSLSRAIVYFTARKATQAATGVDPTDKQVLFGLDVAENALTACGGGEYCQTLKSLLLKVRESAVQNAATCMASGCYRLGTAVGTYSGQVVGQRVGQAIARYYGFSTQPHKVSANSEVAKKGSGWGQAMSNALVSGSESVSQANGVDALGATAWVLSKGDTEESRKEAQGIATLLWGTRKVVGGFAYGASYVASGLGKLAGALVKLWGGDPTAAGRDFGVTLLNHLDQSADDYGWTNYRYVRWEKLKFTEEMQNLWVNKLI